MWQRLKREYLSAIRRYRCSSRANCSLSEDELPVHAPDGVAAADRNCDPPHPRANSWPASCGNDRATLPAVRRGRLVNFIERQANQTDPAHICSILVAFRVSSLQRCAIKVAENARGHQPPPLLPFLRGRAGVFSRAHRRRESAGRYASDLLPYRVG